MKFAVVSHKGMVRKHNEDAWYLPEPESPLSNVAIVADGMGGHQAGEVASHLAVDAAVEAMLQTEIPAMERVEKAFHAANDRVYNAARENSAYTGMGTTMILALFIENSAYLGHVGDSRAYLWHNQLLLRITRDHSLMADWLDAGFITPEEVDHHPYRHVITRALGTHDEVEIDHHVLPFGEGDRLLICSDGLNNEVIEADMMEILGNESDLQNCAQKLVDAAIKGGGRDNITVLIVQGEVTTP